jgi:hypothetical protein
LYQGCDKLNGWVTHVAGTTDVIGEFSTHDETAVFSVSRRKLRRYRNLKVWIAVVVDHDLRGCDTFVPCNIDSLNIM